MGKKDKVTKKYLEHNEEFADIVNLALCDGKPVFKAENFHDVNPNELVDIPNLQKNKVEEWERLRDVLKSYKMSDGQEVCRIQLIIGAEAQSNVHYAMPVKNMAYDAINYARQAQVISEQNRKTHKFTSNDEFLSGVCKGDKLIPVITVTVLFTNQEWDAPKTLHDMLDFSGVPEEIKALVNNYTVPVVNPAGISDELLSTLSSTVKNVFGMIKHSNTKEQMQQYLDSNKNAMSQMPTYAAAVLGEFCELKMDLKREVVDVCQATLEIREEGRAEGRVEGRMEGEIRVLVEKLHYTPEQIAKEKQLPLEKVMEIIHSFEE